MFNSKNSLRIISLLAAVLLWLYVMGEVDPEMRTKINNVPVSLINTEQLASKGLAAVYEEPIMISVDIRGKRSNVNEAKKGKLIGYLDVSECEKGTNAVEISVELPEGVTLENMSVSMATLEVEKLVYQSKPVEVEFSESEPTNETVPWVLGQDLEVVTVSGAKSSVEKVECVYGLIETEEVPEKKEKTLEVAIAPVDSEGVEIYGLELASESTEVKVKRLSAKAVKLELISEDGEAIEDDEPDVPSRIRIVGKKSAIKDIESVEGIVTELENGSVNIKVELPADIYLMIGEENGKIIWN